MQKQIVLKIYGKVQGVFFRDSSRKKAKELNLSGWARNEPDGMVQIVAEGEEKDLKKLIEWGADGPYHAKVEKMDAEWKTSTSQFDDFMIK
ncbi:MAG: Acylphosphatase [Candidatus Nomurabacteria bacterium GW2011_GWC2_41_8]|uniref:Acylphosphatase n=1 Tax=Candidatus Nomurabacteria bacterium GW2011_GWC2_41_8 TaxID=1618755 RepID=A0A0G0ZMC7_9BACT|nr:MAG: Acylphosphatase [Candidatus Nomurabacteria bacterium GW2011_GWC2_41_8]